MPAKHVDTTEYEFSHGHTPRGHGSWGFAPFNETQDDPNTWLWVSGTYTEAKRQLPTGEWKVLP